MPIDGLPGTRARTGRWARSLPTGVPENASGRATTSYRLMRRRPFHHHHQPVRLPQPPPPFHSTYSAERRLVVPAKPCSVALTQSETKQGRTLLQAVRRQTVQISPNTNLFSARTHDGQRGSKKIVVRIELDINPRTWARRWVRTGVEPRCMRTANEHRQAARHAALISCVPRNRAARKGQLTFSYPAPAKRASKSPLCSEQASRMMA